MDLTADLFISCNYGYNTIDESQTKWIADFIKHSGYLLQRLTGRLPKIITSGNETKDMDCSKISCCIIIIDNNYLRTEELAKEYGQIVKSNRNIYKIILEPILPELTPKSFYDYFNNDFYRFEQSVDDEVPNVKLLDHQSDSLYWFKLIEVSYNIFQALPNESISAKQKKQRTKGIVFLAETTHDLNHKRDLVKNELLFHGYKVYPSKPLPNDADKFSKEVIQYIEEASLSIHLIGNEYGKLLGNSEFSKMDLQNQIAANYYLDNYINNKKGIKKPFFRLIWLPPNLEIKEQNQFKFVEQLKRNVEMIEGAEIIQAPIEELKSIIRQKISEKNQTGFQSDSSASSKTKIYCIHEKEQTDNVKILKDISSKFGFETVFTEFSDDEVNNFEAHQEKLLVSHAVLIVYEKENHQWISTKLKDLLKISGYGKKEPFLAKAILTKNPLPKLFDNFIKDILVLEFNGNIEENALKPFFKTIAK